MRHAAPFFSLKTNRVLGAQAQWTALHRACAYHGRIMEYEDHDEFEERLKIVQLLIDKGADLNVVTRVRRHPVLAV